MLIFGRGSQSKLEASDLPLPAGGTRQVPQRRRLDRFGVQQQRQRQQQRRQDDQRAMAAPSAIHFRYAPHACMESEIGIVTRRA